ncbi:MAG: autotransporter outer membrane beta-barrel domain-containing protein [Granulosicoccus sp.]
MENENRDSVSDEPSIQPLQLSGTGLSDTLYKMLTPGVGRGNGLAQNQYQLYNRIVLESVDTKATEFSSESEVVKAAGQFGVLRQFTDRYILGATLDVSVSDGSTDNTLDSRCNIDSVGEEEGYSAGIGIIQTLLLNDFVSLSANLSGFTFEDTYRRSLCLLTEETDIFFPDPEDENHIPAGIGERFEGVITGKPSGLKLSAAVEARASFRVAALIVNPHIGFVGSETSIDPYTETDSGDTGATLQYDAREESSRIAQWGLSLELPLQSRRGIVSPFIDMTGFREHGDGQQRLIAQFSEDNRNTPTRFSFLSTPVDRDYGMVALGVDWYYRPGAVGQIKIQSLLGNDFSDVMQVEARLAISF